MKTIVQIFKRDIRRITRNWVALLVVIGICLIPSLYAWFNIAANYDPYSNTQNIRIAVANLDQGVSGGPAGTLDAGTEIVKNLRKNRELGWRFVTETEAVKGVRSGDYYAAIVIPEDFSRSLVSVFSGKIERPQILYYLNEKKNAIAPKITDTGASTIQEEINTTFVAIAAETVSGLIEDSASLLTGEFSAAKESALSKLDRVNQNLDHYQKVLGNLLTALDKGIDGTKDANALLDDVKTTAESGAESLDNASDLLSSIRKNVSAFSLSFGGTLSDGDALLQSLGNTAVSNISSLNTTAQTVNTNVDQMIRSLQSLLQQNQKIIEQLKALDELLPGSASSKISEAIRTLQADNQRHQTLLKQLQSGNKGIENLLNSTETASSGIASSLKENRAALKKARRSFEKEGLPSLNHSLDSVAHTSGLLSGILSGVSPSAEQMKEIVESLDQSFRDTKSAVSGTKRAVESVQTRLSQVTADLNALSDSRAYQDFLRLTDINSESAADFISAPVNLDTEAFYPVKNYGSAMAPFYTNLAIWVGGIVLIAIFRLEVDRDRQIPRFTPIQAYFGRWLLYIVIGQIQALIICAGDLLLLGVQCVSPPAFLFAGMLASFVYVNLIYALSITFKHIGKALSVILVIVQIPGSAGTYPIEMTPGFFQKLNPLLPFTYGIDAMREALAGIYGSHYAVSLLCLALYVPLALLIGIAIRPLFLNLNLMFDKKLAATDLMICEESGGIGRSNIRLATIVKVLSDQEDFRKKLKQRTDRFESKYKTRVRRGFFCILVIPLIFLVLMFSIDSRLVFLVLWIASIIGIALYLICLEYIHDRLKRHRHIAGMSSRSLMESMKQKQGPDEKTKGGSK